MAWQVVKWVLDSAPVTDPSAQLVLVVIAEHAHLDGTGAYPAVSTIARRARMSERSVKRALRRLEALDVLRVERGAGVRGQNVYRIMGCQIVTGDKLSPLSDCHPPGDSVSPLPCQRVTPPSDNVSPEPSVEPSGNHPEPKERAHRARRHGSARRYQSPAPPTMDDTWETECRAICKDRRCGSAYVHAQVREARLP